MKIKCTKKKSLFPILLAVALMINIIIQWFSYDLWWDEAVYIGIGKYIWTFGVSGFFEIFRPPVIPLLLGGFWSLGMDPIIVGKFFATIFFGGFLYMTYRIGEMIQNKTTGFYAALLLAITPFIYVYSSKILTGIPSTFFMLTAFYIYLKDEKTTHKTLFYTGLFAGLSFLTRFPQGIGFAVLGLIVFLKDIKHNYKTAIKNSIILAFGFLLIVAPYLTYNFYAYGNPARPFTLGSQIINDTAWFHKTGVLFYVTDLITKNPFFLFAFFGIICFFQKKEYLVKKKAIVFTALFLNIVYFSFYLPAKDTRFSIIFLPYLALVSAIGLNYFLMYLSNLIKKNNTIQKLNSASLKNILVVLFVFVFTITSFWGAVQINNTHLRWLESRDSENPYSTFVDYIKSRNVNGTTITSNIIITAYIDNHMVSLVDWKLADEIYEQEKDKTSIIVLDSCAIICAPADEICENTKSKFIKRMKKENKELFHSKTNSTEKPCDYYVFNVI